MTSHDSHPDATLSLTEHLPDGSVVYQSWTICACSAPGLRDMLGDPHHETYATREQFEATAQAVADVDSGPTL